MRTVYTLRYRGICHEVADVETAEWASERGARVTAEVVDA